MVPIETDTFLLVGLFIAAGAGILSFLSPCVLPIFPAYLSYITGVSVKEIQDQQNSEIRKRLLSHSFFFLLGVSIVFISLGIGASFLGKWIKTILTGEMSLLIQRIAGVFIVLMGFVVAGWFNLEFLMKERRLQVRKSGISYIGTFFVGLGFAAGWTPCTGPIFGSILLLATTNPNQGLLYIIMYVIGFALPFLILTFFIGQTRWIVKYSGIIMKIGGVIMIIMGLVLFGGFLPVISSYLLELIQGTWLEKIG